MEFLERINKWLILIALVLLIAMAVNGQITAHNIHPSVLGMPESVRQELIKLFNP